MTDYTELKRLAEAAPEGPWFGPEYVPGTSYVFDVDLGTLLEYQSIDSEKDACLLYVAAANPAAVLALVAENERLEIERAELWRGKRDVEATRDTKSAVIAELKAEIAGLKTGYEAYERVNAELKAENEALRKGAARYEWLRQARSGYIEVVEWIGPHATGMTGEDLDALLDAAMGKGERS